MLRAEARDNRGKGAVFEGEDAGDVLVTVTEAETGGNDDRDGTGIEAVQEDDGMDSQTARSKTAAILTA